MVSFRKKVVDGMEEKNILDSISEAEAEALSVLSKAQEQAAAIVTEAETKALEISKSTEGIAARRTEEILSRAKEEADAAYRKALSVAEKDAKAYADGILEHVQPQVAAIVGR